MREVSTQYIYTVTNREFTTLLKSPQSLKSEQASSLKELIDAYPYFAPARMLYLHALQQSSSIHFENTLNHSSLYVRDRRWLYYFIYPEKNIECRPEYVRSEKNTGDYFGILKTVECEGKDVNQSLKVLAERLKQARLDTITEPNFEQEKEDGNKQPAINNVQKREQAANFTEEDYTEKVKQLMREKKYGQALKVLKELNLNNPKKSIYFADQIRFLEKILDNIKK